MSLIQNSLAFAPTQVPITDNASSTGYKVDSKGNGRQISTDVLLLLMPGRFLTRITIDRGTGCWNWTGSTWGLPRHKYGQIRRGAEQQCRPISTHVFSYQLVYGPVPEGKEIDHLCENKLCCNPLHLEAVTHQENTRRRGKTR